MSDGDPTQLLGRELRSFGRKRGRKLSARQQTLQREALPRLALDLKERAPERAEDIFSQGGGKVGDVWLEIGFGGAEHLIYQASANPGVGLIGCEPFEEGVVKALTAIEEKGLRNVRLYADDVRHVLRWLPAGSLGRVFMLYPDPWPKKRHEKRRLFSVELLDLLAQAMKGGAELRVATDSGDYARTVLACIARRSAFHWLADTPADWRERTLDWPQTRYEAKAIREGRISYYLRFTTRAG